MNPVTMTIINPQREYWPRGRTNLLFSSSVQQGLPGKTEQQCLPGKGLMHHLETFQQ